MEKTLIIQHQTRLRNSCNVLFGLPVTSFCRLLNNDIQLITGESIESKDDFYTDREHIIPVLNLLGFGINEFGIYRNN